MLIVVFLVVTHRWFQFSNLAYLLMSARLFLHTIGGHYTFERVPFDCVTNLIGAQRNQFDRVARYGINIVEAGESSFAKVFASAKNSAWAKATADAMAGKLSVTASVVRYSLDTRCAAS